MTTSLRWLGIAALLISYAVLANYTNQTPHTGALGALVALAPLAVTALMVAWHSSQRNYMFILLMLAAGALWLLWPELKRHYGWIYWLEHESVQWALFLAFGRTLFAHKQPLCTQFAEIIHGPLSAAHTRYAYQVTWAWTLFFAVMIGTSTWLFFAQSLAAWSIFANFIFLPLVACMFVIEYGVRKLILPELKHASIIQTVRAFMQHSAPRA